ncbi:MAG: hypothetical protein KJ077_47880 [Anaerolineae bacterium]|nr:hypothetical protein [Anaerolineae bacterium]
MSCETNAIRVSGTVGAKAGISVIQSKFSGVTGRLVGGLNRKMEQVTSIPAKVSGATERVVGGLNHKRGQAATMTLRAIESFDGPKSIDSLMPVATLVELGAMLSASKLVSKPTPMLPAMTIVPTGPDSKLPRLTLPPQPAPEWAVKWMDNRRQLPDSFNEPATGTEREKQKEEKRKRAVSAAERTHTLADRLPGLLRSRTILGIGVLKLVQATSNFAGTGIARITRTDQSGIVDGVEQQFFFTETSKIPATVWKSNLTPLLNLADSWPGKVLKSEGIMFNVNGKTWHRGTMVIQTAQGERTITHLQSLCTPATHYYFGRKLLLNEAVGIVSGQKGFNAKHLPNIPDGRPATGYAGQISEVESLFPLWAAWKRNLIMAHLRWGDNPSGVERRESQIEAGDIAPPASRLGSGQDRRSGGRERRPDRKDNRRPRQAGSSRAVAPPAAEVDTSPKTHELHPLDNIGTRAEVDGQEVKVMIRRVVGSNSPNQPTLADATYFDEEAGVWKEVTDAVTRQKLAAQVEAGLADTWE